MAEQILFAAEKIWRSMPKAKRRNLNLGLESTTIVDYSLEIVEPDLLMSGTCRACGGEVRRLIEMTGNNIPQIATTKHSTSATLAHTFYEISHRT